MMHRNNLIVVGLGLAGAVLVALGCEIVVVNDFPAARGWGVGSGGEGTGGTTVTTSSTTDVPTTTTSTTSIVVANCAETCHGGEENAAPPVDTLGNSSTSSPTVGAHQAHLRISDWHLVKGCNQCHSAPTTPVCPNFVEGHCDNQVQHVWGDLATAADAQPSFDWVEHTCAGSYCHGATLASAEVDGVTPIQEPLWASVDGSQVACGTGCHTNPPATEGHVPYEANVNNCQNCHSAVIIGYEPGDPPDTTWRDKNLHVNGIIEVDEGV